MKRKCLQYNVRFDCTGLFPDATSQQIKNTMFQHSVALEDALRKEGRLCGLLGHTIVGRYDLKGDFETVLANMIYFRKDIMAKDYSRDELIAIRDMIGKRCNDFLARTYYNTDYQSYADKLRDNAGDKLVNGKLDDESIDSECNEFLSSVQLSEDIISNYMMTMHNAKQCLCHSNK